MDLADPKIPLYKLGKNIPHGAKGHDLLDLLHTNKVEISRAVWFVRVFGSNETVRSRLLQSTSLLNVRIIRRGCETRVHTILPSTAWSGRVWSRRI